MLLPCSGVPSSLCEQPQALGQPWPHWCGLATPPLSPCHLPCLHRARCRLSPRAPPAPWCGFCCPREGATSAAWWRGLRSGLCGTSLVQYLKQGAPSPPPRLSWLQGEVAPSITARLMAELRAAPALLPFFFSSHKSPKTANDASGPRFLLKFQSTRSTLSFSLEGRERSAKKKKKRIIIIMMK